jgi:hypothetical protein
MLDFNIRGTSRDIDRKPIPSNSFLDSLQYPDIDRDSFNPEDVFLLPEDVNNFKKPRNIKNSITSTPPMAQSRMPTMTPPSMPTPRPSMPMNMPSIEEPEPEQDSTNFLGSLLAQGTAMLGAGIQGGNVGQVGRSFEAGRQRAEQDRKAKALVDPKSEESKRRRMVFEKALGSAIPEEYSATDLNDPVVLQSIRDKRMQELAPKGGTGIGLRGGGVAQAKPEKEVKTDTKRLGIYRDLAQSLSNSINVIENVEKLDRSRGGGILPTYNIDKRVTEGLINQNAQPLVKQLAGVGTVTDDERKTFLEMVPNANMPKEQALSLTKAMAQKSVIGTLEELNFDLQTGQINKKDYDTIIKLYNKNLSNPKLGINKKINEQGELVDSTPSIDRIKFNEEQ